MNRPLLAFICCFAIMVGTGCNNVKGKKITEQNRDKIFEEIKNTRDLTVEEVQLLQEYMLREGLKNAFGGKDDRKEITVGQMIEEQKNWLKDEKLREQKEKELRDKAQAEAALKRKVLQEALAVSVYDKGFSSADYRDYITMKFAYQNNSGKDIRGFKGIIEFQNLFGDTITTSTLAEDAIVQAGSTKKVSKTLNYNQFRDEDTRLRNTDLNNMKVLWKPEVILFTDGSSLKVDESN